MAFRLPPVLWSRAARSAISAAPAFALLIAYCAVVQGASASAQEQIEQSIAASPILSQGHIGFEFADAETGEVLAQHSARQLFTPASNTKLYTTALALVRLGITYRFKTSVRTSAPLSSHTETVPDLIFIAGGDPNLSDRTLPYSVTQTPATQTGVSQTHRDPLKAIEGLADQIAAKGVKCVSGNLVADDSRYPWDPYPDGWTFDDGTWYYGAPVSAFSVNDNMVHVTVTASTPGELAGVELDPNVGSLVLMNEVVTDRTNVAKVSMSRIPGSDELVISGTIGQSAPPAEEDVAVPDAVLFAAQALRFELENRGIPVLGDIVALHRDLTTVPEPLGGPRIVATPQGTELASLESAPLFEAVQIVNKVSQNLHAEMLLREVGYATRSVGTLAAGIEERKTFLAEAGIPNTAYSLADGSGLARQGLTSPEATVALLRYMWKRPEKESWLNSLPIGGVDGSLKDRFHNVDGSDRVHAKTGSLAHVAALSGYLQTKSGRWLIFSMMANAELNDGDEVRKFFDQACGVFLKQ